MGHNSFGLSLLLLVSSLGHGFEVKLKHLSTIYLPHRFNNDRPEFEFKSDAVERAVFEPTGKIIYAVGSNLIHIINASNPLNLTYLNHVTTPNKELTDVTVCGRALFVTYIDKSDLLHGGVLQYQLFCPRAGNITFTRLIQIGSQPDMLRATKNCTLVVALENPAVIVNNQLQDPPGGVGIIRFPQGVRNSPHKNILDFTAFDHRFQGLARRGVRWVYRGNNNEFSNDVEPESVTFNDDQTKAFVSLQDNNAIAEVDLASSNITAIYGLGFKNWTSYEMDPSDEDHGIFMASWPVYGIYQPDGIEWFRWADKDYIISANEGDTKEYNSINFQEDKRGHEFSDAELSDSLSSTMREALRNRTKLGRLQLSSVDGKDQTGKFEKFYTFGGRSFSIWRATDMTQVFDSGSELSHKTMELRRDLFNNDIVRKGTKVLYGMDRRSDNRGPEPESVCVAEIQDYLFLFVGISMPGSIAVYSMAPGKIQPQFLSLYTDGIPQSNYTWAELYDTRRLHAVDPEYIGFIDRDSGLANYPLLLVTGADSGTVSLLKVELTGMPNRGSSTIALAGSALMASILLVLSVLSTL